MKNFYQMKLDEVYKTLETSAKGLDENEAKLRLEEEGPNELKEKNKKSAFKILISQFSNMMILFLILVGFVSLIYALVNNESVIESIVIFSCVLVNTIMGFVQEMKSENAIDALKTMTESKARVKRNNTWVEINTKEIVPGDIILLEAGDKIPADARIIRAINAQVDESILTGESLAVEKEECVLDEEKIIQEQKNIIFSGTNIVSGRIEAIVISTGMDTELGKIAGSLDRRDDAPTPLQVKIKKVSAFITVLACFLIAGTLCYGLIMKMDALSIIMLCISMVLASVPEVLPVSITATLTIGVQQMSKKKTIVKQLSAIETLGATQVICSDKTGTITTNQLTLTEIYANDKTYQNVKVNNKDLRQIQLIIGLCNNNEVDQKNNGEFIGDPVEEAFSKYLDNLGITLPFLRKTYKRIAELPFDSTRKLMSTINEVDGKTLMLTKGSLGEILAKSKKYYKNGKIYTLTPHVINKFLAQEKKMSKKAYKVLACCYKEIEKKKEYNFEDENDFILVGLVGLIDPPKDSVKEAVEKCLSAHLKPIMITGDSLTTAMAVAKDVGIASRDSQGIEGKRLDGLTDDQLVSFVKKYTVFARVTPDHKVRIVRAFQSAGKVVAMTGDGVNDAPALKLAHVGVGMGRAGTDVTKNVADIILMDDSFATIVTAVEEGRRIYKNVLKTILYNLSSNFAEIFLIIAGMILLRDIISPLHILYIDIIADTIPSIALAYEKNGKNAMREKPFGLNRRVFTPFMIVGIIISALLEAGLSLIIFFVAESWYGYEVASTLALLSVVINELVFAYNCKELKEMSFKKGLLGNKVLNISTLAILLIQIPVFFTSIGSLFGLVPITVTQFLIVIGLNIVFFFVIELLKPLWVKVKDE